MERPEKFTQPDLSEQNRAFMQEAAEQLGYSVEDISSPAKADAFMTANGIKTQGRSNDWVTVRDVVDRKFYGLLATRADKERAAALIAVHPGSSDCYAADFYSPSYYEGHGGNHDFNHSELKGNLKHALEGAAYPKK